MAWRRPRIIEGHLLLGADPELDIRPGGVNYIIERPAAADLPEVIWIVDSDDEDVPIYISLDEEEEDEVVVPMGDEGEAIPPVDDEDELMEVDEDEEEDTEDEDTEDEEDEDTEDEDTDDSEDWLDSFSEDSGYGSISQGEDDDDIRPPSSLVQEFPPDDFWQGW